MKKELGVHPYLFPMPVLMIATYGDDDTVDVMNMAWGGICAENMVSLNIDEGHKTSENIKKRGAFTLSIFLFFQKLIFELHNAPDTAAEQPVKLCGIVL